MDEHAQAGSNEPRSGFQHLFTQSRQLSQEEDGGEGAEGQSADKQKQFALLDDEPVEPMEAIVSAQADAREEENDYEKRNRLENFLRPAKRADEVEDSTVGVSSTSPENYVDDVPALAGSFCRGNRTEEEIREEWFKEGGLKDTFRLYFKRKRKQALKNKSIG